MKISLKSLILNLKPTPLFSLRPILKSIIYNPYSDSKGFTTVELLITIFVAAAFLTSGYQLFDVIIRDSGEVRAAARANNAAYDILQRHKTDANFVKIVCADNNTSIVNNIPSPAIPGLSNVKYSVAFTCPNTEVANLTKITVTLTYGSASDPKNVVQATYATK